MSGTGTISDRLTSESYAFILSPLPVPMGRARWISASGIATASLSMMTASMLRSTRADRRASHRADRRAGRLCIRVVSPGIDAGRSSPCWFGDVSGVCSTTGLTFPWFGAVASGVCSTTGLTFPWFGAVASGVCSTTGLTFPWFGAVASGVCSTTGLTFPWFGAVASGVCSARRASIALKSSRKLPRSSLVGKYPQVVVKASWSKPRLSSFDDQPSPPSPSSVSISVNDGVCSSTRSFFDDD